MASSDRKKAYMKKWRAEHADHIREYAAAYRADHPGTDEKKREYMRKWREENRDHVNEYYSEWRRKRLSAMTPEELAAYKDRRHEANRKWCAAHPEANRDRQSRYRWKKALLPLKCDDGATTVYMTWGEGMDAAHTFYWFLRDFHELDQRVRAMRRNAGEDWKNKYIDRTYRSRSAKHKRGDREHGL